MIARHIENKGLMMNLRVLLLCLIALHTMASAAGAEIYKWRDKDGNVRYSDVPPPSNVKQEALLGKKIPKPTGQAPLTAVDGDATSAANKQKAIDREKEKVAGGKPGAHDAPLSKDDAAAKRARDAETAKKTDEAKQAELKLKEENCKAAQANLKTYTVGGRLMRTNDKGEREYLGDADISKGKTDSQADVDKYCDQ